MSSITLQSDFNIDANTVSPNSDGSRFEEASINAYDDTANLLYRLSSPETYYRKNTGFEFEQPEFVYQSSDTAPLNLSAEKGYMRNNSSLIKLLGNVNLMRYNPSDDTPEYLHTGNATIDIDLKKAYTSDKVTFRQHKKTTEGVGMTIDLEAQTIKLKSNIKVLNVL